jgi:DNA polymerase
MIATAETARATPAFPSLVADVRSCVACDRVAHSHVLSEANGNLAASVVFVAEAVGRRGGAVTGVPLTRDESGKRFGDFLRIAAIDRAGTFVTNAVLCNPLDEMGRNRAPSRRELARCRPFLARTLEIAQAPVVVALGRVALESLRTIAPHHAEMPRDVASAIPWHNRTLVLMYHPSRQSTLHRSQAAQEEDWRRLGALVRERWHRAG